MDVRRPDAVGVRRDAALEPRQRAIGAAEVSPAISARLDACSEGRPEPRTQAPGRYPEIIRNPGHCRCTSAMADISGAGMPGVETERVSRLALERPRREVDVAAPSPSNGCTQVRA